tara:strand:- start:107 stop:535 length:429 start_codon:yes stop_codon:yes gene_type:complete
MNSQQRRLAARSAARLAQVADSSELAAPTNPVHAFQAGHAKSAYAAIGTLSKNRMLARQVLSDESRSLASRAYAGVVDHEADRLAASRVIAAQQLQSDLVGAYIDAVVADGRALTQADHYVIQDLTGKASTKKDRAEFMANL